MRNSKRWKRPGALCRSVLAGNESVSEVVGECIAEEDADVAGSAGEKSGGPAAVCEARGKDSL